MRQQVLEHTDGYVYVVTPMYSDCFYGRLNVYWVRTSNPRPSIDDIVKNIIGEKTAVSEKKYHELNEGNPSIYTHLLPHYRSTFVSDNANGHYEIVVTRRSDD